MENVHVQNWTCELVNVQIKKITNGGHLHRQFIRNIMACLRHRKNNNRLISSVLKMVYVLADKPKWRKKFVAEGFIECLYAVWKQTDTKGKSKKAKLVRTFLHLDQIFTSSRRLRLKKLFCLSSLERQNNFDESFKGSILL